MEVLGCRSPGMSWRVCGVVCSAVAWRCWAGGVGDEVGGSGKSVLDKMQSILNIYGPLNCVTCKPTIVCYPSFTHKDIKKRKSHWSTHLKVPGTL